VPAAALRLLYGEMAEIVTTGQRAVPARALELGYEFSHPRLDEALRTALSRD
jgi:NAD dependent epimerase/dehydratase family enzyme